MSGKNSLSYIFSRNKGKVKNIWSDIMEAISGSDKDFTATSVRKAIFLLSIPMILEMMMESVFAVVDIFFVSKLGSDAVAMVGITESLMTIIYAIGMGIGTGATAMISRRIGERKPEEASKAALQAIILAIFVALAIAIPGVIFSENILVLMGATAEVAEEASGYTSIMLGGNVVIMLLFIINAIFRSSGDAAVSMRVLWIANFINIVLDPCLIFGIGPIPALGLEGAAIATTTGRGLAVIYQFYLLFKGKGRVTIKNSPIVPNFEIIRRLVKLSIGGIAQMLIATSSWIGLMRIMAEFGNDVLAGYTISIRIIVFSLLPAWGLSNAAATLVGQNLGAKKPERAEKSVWTTGFVNMGVMAVFGIVFILFPEFFMRMFIDKQVVIDAGVASLRFLSYGLVFYGLGMVVIQSFNGAGDTITPTRINLLCFWLIEIPLAYLLALGLGVGEQGVYISILASESVMTIIGIYLFRKGKWKLKEV